MPEWISTMEWLEPKLVLLVVLIGTVLWLSNLGNSQRARQERSRASRPVVIVKNTRR